MITLSSRVENLREALILAGINEINANGIAGFSIRRVADACNVSCAAPYRHFKDKRDFIAAIIDYVNDQWAARQEEILAECGDTLREQIIEILLNYIKFLWENPSYRSILLLKDNEFDNLYHKKRTQFGSLTQTLEAELHARSGYDEESWRRKVMTVRSLIFGAIFLFDAGEYEFNETNMEYLRYTINREFEIN